MIPPVGAVIILHYFFHKKDYMDESYPHTAVNPGGIFSGGWRSACRNLCPVGIKPLNSLLVAAVIFVIIDRIFGKRTSSTR